MTPLKWLPILILIVGLTHPALAATVTFTVVEDTTLVDFSDEFFDLRNRNFRGSPVGVAVGLIDELPPIPFVEHGLMRFDVTSLAGHFTTIKSATLRLFPAPFGILGVEGGAGPVTVYRLAAANTGWGGSTWNQRVPGFENWAGSAGASTPGIDFLTPFIASGGPEQGEAVHDLVFTDVSFIPSWVAGDNPGILLQTEAFFANAYEAGRSELTITFATPEPAMLWLLATGLAALGGMAGRRRGRRG